MEENVAVPGRCCHVLFEKKTVKRAVQCHVFAQSPPGRRPSDKYRVKTSHSFRFVFAVLFGSKGNSFTVSAQSGMCLCTHILHNAQTLVGRKTQKMREQWMPRAKEIIARVSMGTRTIRWPALDYDKNCWSYASIPTHTRTFKAWIRTPYIYNEYRLLEPTVFPKLHGYVPTKTKSSFRELSVQSLQWIRYTSGYSRRVCQQQTAEC